MNSTLTIGGKTNFQSPKDCYLGTKKIDESEVKEKSEDKGLLPSFYDKLIGD